MTEKSQSEKEFLDNQTIAAFAAYRKEKDAIKRKAMIEFLSHSGKWEGTSSPTWTDITHYRLVDYKTIKISGIAPGWLCSMGMHSGYWLSKDKPTCSGIRWHMPNAKYIDPAVLRDPPVCSEDWKLNLWKIE